MAKQRQNLSGKVVAITGGARGIGKATATALVRKGCRVAIGDLDLNLAGETAAGLGGGTIAHALPSEVGEHCSLVSGEWIIFAALMSSRLYSSWNWA